MDRESMVLFLMIVLAVSKLYLSLVSNSHALLADTLHTLVNTLVILSLWTYTYHREKERLFNPFSVAFLSIVVIASVITLIGSLVDMGVNTKTDGLVVSLVSLASLIFYYSVSRLLADSEARLDITRDAFTSVLVLTSGILTLYGYELADDVVGAIVSLLVLAISLKKMLEGVHAIFRTPSPEESERVRRLVSSMGLTLISLEVSRLGPFAWANVTVYAGGINAEDEEIMELLEKRLLNYFKSVEITVIR